MTSADLSRSRRLGLDPPPYGRPQPRRTRWLLILLPVLAIFIGFGAIVWLAYVEGAPASAVGEPPLIKADTRPIKLPPDDPGGRDVADQGTLDELLAEGEVSGAERLRPPPEEPLVPPSPEILAEAAAELEGEVAEEAATARGAAGEGGAEPAPAAPEPRAERAAAATPAPDADEPADAAAEEPTELARAEAPEASEPSDAEDAIRSLFRSETPARAPAAPAPEPDVPDRSAGAGAPSPDVAEARPQPPETTRPQPAPPVARAETGSNGAGPGGGAPAASRAAEPTREVRTTLAAAPASRLARPASDLSLEGPHYRIQLAAVRNEADAQRAWDLFQVDYGDVLAGIEPIFERGETSNGVFYRVQLGPYASLDRAEGLCEELKQRNASCFVLRR